MIVKRVEHPSIVLQVSAWQLVIGSLPLLVGAAFPTAGWYWLVQRHDVGRLSLFLFLVPIFGLAIATLTFGERVGPLEGLGVFATLAGIALIAIDSWHTPEARDPAGARPREGTRQEAAV